MFRFKPKNNVSEKKHRFSKVVVFWFKFSIRRFFGGLEFSASNCLWVISDFFETWGFLVQSPNEQSGGGGLFRTRNVSHFFLLTELTGLADIHSFIHRKKKTFHFVSLQPRFFSVISKYKSYKTSLKKIIIK